MPDDFPNHAAFSAEQRLLAAWKLADALELVRAGRVPLQEGVLAESQHSEVFGGIQGLPMDLGVVAFREPSTITRHKIAFTADWLLKREPEEIAREIGERIHEMLSGN